MALDPSPTPISRHAQEQTRREAEQQAEGHGDGEMVKALALVAHAGAGIASQELSFDEGASLWVCADSVESGEASGFYTGGDLVNGSRGDRVGLIPCSHVHLFVGRPRPYIVLYAWLPDDDPSLLPLAEDQVINVYGITDEDGFVSAETTAGLQAGRLGLVPSTFVRPMETTALTVSITRSSTGASLGVLLGSAAADGMCIVSGVSAGGPAVGKLERGDHVTAVDGVSTDGVSYDKVIDMVRAARSSSVSFSVRRTTGVAVRIAAPAVGRGAARPRPRSRRP